MSRKCLKSTTNLIIFHAKQATLLIKKIIVCMPLKISYRYIAWHVILKKNTLPPPKYSLINFYFYSRNLCFFSMSKGSLDYFFLFFLCFILSAHLFFGKQKKFHSMHVFWTLHYGRLENEKKLPLRFLGESFWRYLVFLGGVLHEDKVYTNGLFSKCLLVLFVTSKKRKNLL